MNVTHRSLVLRAATLAALFGGSVVGVAQAASGTTLNASAPVASGQHVVFDCSKASVSCRIVAVGEAGSTAQVSATVTGANASNVQIVQLPGKPHFIVSLKGQSNWVGSWLATWLHPASWFQPQASAVVELRVPADRPLDISNTNGSVTVRGVHAKLHISAVNTPVRTRDSADLHISTVNGSVHAVVPPGTPNITVSTVNGSISLLVAHTFDTHVSASTVNGRVRNAFAGATGAGRVQLSTVNGSITIER